MYQRYTFILLILILFFAVPASIVAVTSTNYDISPDSDFYSNYQNVNSATYQIEGGVYPIGGNINSATYRLESGTGSRGACGDGFVDPSESCDGSSLAGATCVSRGFASGTLACSAACAFDTSNCAAAAATNTGGGGGGTTTTTPAPTTPTTDKKKPEPPTIDSTFTASSYFTYESSLLIFGKKEKNVDSVEVNTSSAGVTYPTSTSWNALVKLVVGSNTFNIRAVNEEGKSTIVSLTIKRYQSGDINGNGLVNDYDLSKFVRLYGTKSSQGDFDGDGDVDDYDLSRLISKWNR